MLSLIAIALAASAAPAPRPYRALGTEPFWNLSIAPRRITFQDAGNDLRVVVPTPRARMVRGSRTYMTPRLSVTIRRARCNDGMSTTIFADEVRVTVGGRRYEGCGGRVLGHNPL